MNLDIFDVSNNSLGYTSVENLFHIFRLNSPTTATYNIKYINLSNNNIGDAAAGAIAWHLSNRLYPNLRSLDLSRNSITPTDYKCVAEAMKSTKVENLMITFVKQATLIGKEAIKSTLKTFIEYAKEQGVDTTGWTCQVFSLCKKHLIEAARSVFVSKKIPITQHLYVQQLKGIYIYLHIFNTHSNAHSAAYT